MIKNNKNNDQFFCCCCSNLLWYIGKNKTLDTAKASQQSDISTKILKQSSDYFAEYLYENIDQCNPKSIFPSDLKLADITPIYKRSWKTPNIIISQLEYYPLFPKFTKYVSMIKFSSFSILYCPNISSGFVEATTHNTAS